MTCAHDISLFLLGMAILLMPLHSLWDFKADMHCLHLSMPLATDCASPRVMSMSFSPDVTVLTSKGLVQTIS